MEHLNALCMSAGMYTPAPPMPWQSVAAVWAGVGAVAWAIATPFVIRAVKGL